MPPVLERRLTPLQQLNRRVSKTPTLDLLIGEGSDFTRAQYNSLREQIMTQLHTRVYSMEGFKLGMATPVLEVWALM